MPAIISTFSQELKDFYPGDTFSRGYVIAKNRHGIEDKYGLATLSIAGISNEHTQFKDIYALSEHTTRIKKQCKEVWEDCYLIE